MLGKAKEAEMAQGPLCTKCEGEGLVARDGGEANADLHPLLSKSKGICDQCGGSGRQPRSHEANVAAAATASG